MSRRSAVLAILAGILALSVYAHRSGAGVFTELTITKTAVGEVPAMSPPAPAGALVSGTILTFTDSVSNDGELAALNLSISDPLPLDVVFLLANASPGATVTAPAVNTNGVVTATWDAAGGTPGGLTPVAGQRQLAISARICPEASCTTLVNTATASSDNSISEEASSNTPLFPQPDLSITKSASVERVNTGESFSYQLNVANAGPSNSANTLVTDTLPPGILAADVQTTIPGALCSIAFGGGTVTCTFALGAPANQCAAMPIPSSGTITIVALVTNDATGGLNTNSAAIAISGNCGFDPDSSDNTATADVIVVGPAGAPALSPLSLGVLAMLLGLGGMWMLGRRRTE